MICEQLMKRDIEAVSPRDNLRTAARKMRDRGVGFLPVVDDEAHPIGAITDRDLTVRAVAEDHRPGQTRVREIMSGHPVTCGLWDDLRVAEERMVEHHKSRIMCVNEDGALVGIISLADIAEREEGAQALQLLREVSRHASES
jgi:CBS domain-containing protein